MRCRHPVRRADVNRNTGSATSLRSISKAKIERSRRLGGALSSTPSVASRWDETCERGTEAQIMGRSVEAGVGLQGTLSTSHAASLAAGDSEIGRASCRERVSLNV